MIKIGHSLPFGVRREGCDCGGFGELLRQREARRKPLPVHAQRQRWRIRRDRAAAAEAVRSSGDRWWRRNPERERDGGRDGEPPSTQQRRHGQSRERRWEWGKKRRKGGREHAGDAGGMASRRQRGVELGKAAEILIWGRIFPYFVHLEKKRERDR